MSQRDKARGKARANNTSQADVANKKDSSDTDRFYIEPLNLGGLQAPFTWENLARQVQEMDDLERYGHSGREYIAVRKRP
jgi:hypothetical protein